MDNILHFRTSDILKSDKEFVFEKICTEPSNIGYYSLTEQNIDDIVNFSIPKNITKIAIIGIGGSSLGAKAIYKFIKSAKELKRELIFFESTDPLNIIQQLSRVSFEDTHFIVISKSGTTVETMAIFKYLYSKNDNKNSYTFITDKDSPLDSFAKTIGSNVLYLPKNVGGRFSVLSVVGLLPLFLAGIDIKALLKGAKAIKSSFFDNGYIRDTLLKKAIFYAKHHADYPINCTFAYTEALRYFGEWYVQLWAESLGKRQKSSIFNVGVTPISLIGPKDQHSFLQLIMEGSRDKSVTFINIKDFKKSLYVPDIELKNLESLNILNNISFSDLIHKQSQAVKEALILQKDIPIDEIEIERVDEKSIGELMFYYELLTSLVGILINVNTYNQPGVELGKKILKQKLKEKE